MIAIKRIYEEAKESDGFRVLVDRLWPRGVSKEKAKIDLWLKEVAPSTELRQWFGHQVEKWPDFCQRYQQELTSKAELLTMLREKAQQQNVTLLYASRDTEHNEAVVLRDLLNNN